MKLYSFFFKAFIIFLPFIYVSCSDQSVTPEVPEFEFLVDYELLDSIEANQLKTFIGLFDPSIDTEVVRYDASIYKVTYITSYQGESTEASGLVCVPINANMVDFPFFLGMHASISSQAESPSNYTNPLGTGLEFFATLGYISVIPDYLGFGNADEFFHPYLVKESVTRVSADMLNASVEMLRDLNQSHQKEIFVAGYSQGAYNALAMHEAIENDGLLSEWSLGGTSAGGGTYDLTLLTDLTLGQDTYSSPQVLSYLIWSYHNYYQLDGGADEYFQQPYADLIPDLFDGTKTLGQIKSQLTEELNQLLQPSFIAAIQDGGMHPMRQILAQNSIIPWNTSTPINILHSPDDEVIRSENSSAFVSQMKAAGATNIVYTPLQGSHGEAVFPMLINTIFWLEGTRLGS